MEKSLVQRKLWLVEVIALLLALSIASIVVFPIYDKVSAEWTAINFLAVFVFVMFLKWILFLDKSPLLQPTWVKGIFCLALIPLFIWFMTRLNAAQTNFGDGFISLFGLENIDEKSYGMGTFTFSYLSKELVFFLVSAMLLSIALLFRLFRFFYKNAYKIWPHRP